MIRAAVSLLILAAPCTGAAAATFVPVTPARPSANWPAPAPRGEALMQATALALHNRARADYGVAPVRWNEGLAAAARTYATQMAATGIYRHDPTPGRRKLMGENMWKGTRGAFDYGVMVGVMVDERALFRPGVFPNVSATGDWEAVAHWTQIVWPATTEIGCGLASSATTDYFVCRYAPTGNKDGLAMGVSPGAPVQLAGGR